MHSNYDKDDIAVLIKQYLAIFRAHIWVVVLVVMLASAIGVTTAVTSPDQYSAGAMINFDFKNSNPFSSTGSIDGNFIATQVDLIRSKTVEKE